MTEYVTVDVADGIARVTLDRPELRNALTRTVADELREAMGAVDESSGRCILLAGSGPAFCAGGRRERDGLDSEESTAQQVQRVVDRTAGAVRAAADCDLPTIAAVDGDAYSAGAPLAVACDLVLASEDAQISFGFRRMDWPSTPGPRISCRGSSVGRSRRNWCLPATSSIWSARELGLFSRVSRRSRSTKT